jgi:predicted transcriptional regulator
MTRTTATFSVSLPPEMATEFERVRKREHRTRSALVREALRSYIDLAEVRRFRARVKELPEDDAAPDEIEAIRRGIEDFRQGRHRSLKMLRHELQPARQRSRARKP